MKLQFLHEEGVAAAPPTKQSATGATKIWKPR